MSTTLPVRLLNVAFLATSFVVAGALHAQSPVVAPVKPGLWETRMSELDAAGKEVPAPELAAFSKMPPEMRAQMAAMMKGRGVQMPDESGAIKSCLTRELLESDGWQQMAADTGCTTTYSTRSNTVWRWHSSCKSINAESDGEMTFTGPESYRSRITTTSTVSGKKTTTTRVIQAKWLGASCGDVKPLALPTAPARGR